MDIVIRCFKYKYPKDYAEKCGSLLGITAAELLKSEFDRADFYNALR
jgi:hypothetical protein